MLILKLTIVPLGLLVFGIMERLHGPRVAGWLAGFPIVGGPLLLFVTLDHGLGFGLRSHVRRVYALHADIDEASNPIRFHRLQSDG